MSGRPAIATTADGYWPLLSFTTSIPQPALSETVDESSRVNQPTARHVHQNHTLTTADWCWKVLGVCERLFRTKSVFPPRARSSPQFCLACPKTPLPKLSCRPQQPN